MTTSSYNGVMSDKRNTPKPPPVSFYLGDKEAAARRRASLDALAKERGVTRSILVQLIADGIIPLGDNDGEPPKYVSRYEPQSA